MALISVPMRRMRNAFVFRGTEDKEGRNDARDL